MGDINPVDFLEFVLPVGRARFLAHGHLIILPGGRLEEVDRVRLCFFFFAMIEVGYTLTSIKLRRWRVKFTEQDVWN